MLIPEPHTGDVNCPAFWENIYDRGADQWEIRRPPPPLVDFLDRTPPPLGRVAVPGCGRGHDARELARRGYSVVGFDFAPAAIREARALAERDGVDVTYVEADMFTLGREWAGTFDGLWEYVCFCAVHPSRRREYAALVASLVRPGGWFLGCFFPMRAGSAGPPYPVSRRDVHRFLVPPFRIEREFAPTRSVRGRVGQEWMVYALKTASPA